MELTGKIAESLRSTPIVLVILIINVIALTGFGYTLNEISKAAERRDVLLEKCIK